MKKLRGLSGQIKEEVLEAGNYVVLDTDHIEKYDEFKMKNRKYKGPRVSMTYKFEERYKKIIKKKSSEEKER